MERIYQTESVSSVRDSVKTGHPVISQPERVITDVMTTGPVNSVKVHVRKMMIDIRFGVRVLFGQKAFYIDFFFALLNLIILTQQCHSFT